MAQKSFRANCMSPCFKRPPNTSINPTAGYGLSHFRIGASTAAGYLQRSSWTRFVMSLQKVGIPLKNRNLAFLTI
jgi:hypothetical protein